MLHKGFNARALRRPAAVLACAGTVFFWGAATATQLLRPDLDPLVTRLSPYLMGPWGLLLHAAYYTLAAAILCLVAALQTGVPADRRRSIVSLLLVLTAIGLIVTAATKPLSEPLHPARVLSLADGIHLLGALTAFVGASAALGTAAFAWRGLLGVRGARVAIGLALVENLALLSYLLFPAPWTGARQKLVVLLVTVALFLAGARLAARKPLAPAGPTD